MEFFSGKQPNLIGPNMKNTYSKIVNKKICSNTVSDKITEFLGDIYNLYIKENKFIIIIILIIIIFLIYRYYSTKNKIKKKESDELTLDEFKNWILKDDSTINQKYTRFDDADNINNSYLINPLEDTSLIPNFQNNYLINQHFI